MDCFSLLKFMITDLHDLEDSFFSIWIIRKFRLGRLAGRLDKGLLHIRDFSRAISTLFLPISSFDEVVRQMFLENRWNVLFQCHL